MTIPVNRVLLAALLALSALLLGLAPRWASAHDHPSSSASSQAASIELKAGSFAPTWSESCPPVPGRMCGCGSLFVLVGSGKLVPVDANAWTPGRAAAPGAAKLSSSSIPPIAALSLYQARPRAPPLSS